MRRCTSVHSSEDLFNEIFKYPVNRVCGKGGVMSDWYMTQHVEINQLNLVRVPATIVGAALRCPAINIVIVC